MKSLLAISILHVLLSCAGNLVSGQFIFTKILNPGADNTIEYSLGNETVEFRCPTEASILVVTINSGYGVIELEVTNPDWKEAKWSGNRTSSRNPGITVQRLSSETAWFTIRLKRNMMFDIQKDKVTARISAIEYTSQDIPVPGGCGPTSEFALAESTMILRPTGFGAVSVSANAALLAPAYSVSDRDSHMSRFGPCDFAEAPAENGGYEDPLVYELWYLYISECGSDYHKVFDDGSLFNSVKMMSTLEGIHKYGHLQPSTYLEQKPISWGLDISPGQGVVYNVVVFDRSAYKTALRTKKNVKENQFKAVYSPFGTYHCSRGPQVNCSGVPGSLYCNIYPECVWDEGSKTCTDNEFFEKCETLFDVYLMIFYMFLGCLGLFLGILGHRYFKAELLIFGFFIFASGAYVGATYLPIDTPARLGLTLAGGFVGGFLILFTWYCMRGIAVTMVLIGIVHGNFVSSFIFATSVGEMTIWLNPFNFWMTYACMTLMWPIFMLLKDRAGNVLATSLSGSYCLLLAVNYFIPSSFDDILINTLVRATNPSFAQDYTGNYFSQTYNGCSNVQLNVAMLVIWISLTIGCFILQWVVLDGRNREIPFSDTEFEGCCGMLRGICRPFPIAKSKHGVRTAPRVQPYDTSLRAYASAEPTMGRRSSADVGQPLSMIGGRDFQGHSGNRFSRTSASSEPSRGATSPSRWSGSDTDAAEAQMLYANRRPQQQRQLQQQQQQQQQQQRRVMQRRQAARSAPTNATQQHQHQQQQHQQHQHQHHAHAHPLEQDTPDFVVRPTSTSSSQRARSRIYEDADPDLIPFTDAERDELLAQSNQPTATSTTQPKGTKAKQPKKKHKPAVKAKGAADTTDLFESDDDDLITH